MSKSAIIITTDGSRGRLELEGTVPDLSRSLHEAMNQSEVLKEIVLNVAANYERINAKVEAMEQNEFLEEVKNIMRTHKPEKE